MRSWIGKETLFRKLAAASEKKSPDVGVDFPFTLLETNTEDERENHDVLLNKDVNIKLNFKQEQATNRNVPGIAICIFSDTLSL